MHILFLSHYFPPEVNAPASRTFEHCREWVRAGHRATVITCAPNHPGGVAYPGYRNRLCQWQEVDGIRVLRLWTYLAANQGVVRRSLNYLSFMMAAILAAPWVGKVDVVLTTTPQFFNGLAGYFVGKLKRAPWILEVRDLWPGSIVAVGAVDHPPLLRLLTRLEAWAYRKATRIVAVTESFRRHIEATGAAAAKIQVVKNGVDLATFQGGDGDPNLAGELGADGKFIAAYFGTHGMAHHLETVLEAAQITADRPDILYLMAGDGAARAGLVEMRDRLGLQNVVMLDQQPKERMPELWQCCDASLVLLKKDDLFKTVIPSKIFEAMAMARPIVLGLDGECRELVAAADCAIAIEPENAAELAQAVLRLADDPPFCRRLGANGRGFVAAHFDRTVLARRYLDLIEDVVANRYGSAG